MLLLVLRAACRLSCRPSVRDPFATSTGVFTMRIAFCAGVLFAAVLGASGGRADDAPLRIALFQADVTPPIGAPLCDGLVPPAAEIVDQLSARGVVLLTKEKPVVLCALDWVGIGNSGYDEFREGLAEAAGTTRERVAVHCLHPH